MILETEWAAPGGTVRVIDFMPERDEAPDVVRIVEGIEGRVDMRSELRFRFGYGDVVPWVREPRRHARRRRRPGRRVAGLRRGAHGRDFASYGDFTVGAGQRETFSLTWNPSYQHRPYPVDPEAALVATERFWQGWADRCTYDGAVPRRRPALAAHPQGADLCADRRDHRGGHDLAAGGDRRRSATGTTATAGCGTPRSPCRRWSRRATPRRRWPGGSGCCARSPAARSGCRSSTAWPASGTRWSASCPGCPATRGPHRCGSATARSTSASSTSTAR